MTRRESSGDEPLTRFDRIEEAAMSRMLLADDLSADGGLMLGTAASLALRLGVSLTVLHVVENAEFEGYAREQTKEGGYLDVMFGERRGQIRERVSLALGDEDHVVADVEVARGAPAEIVVERLRSGDFEFGAIGIRSRSRVNKLVFGSTAQSVLLQSPCPILTIPLG